jgi:hypothetical protein
MVRVMDVWSGYKRYEYSVGRCPDARGAGALVNLRKRGKETAMVTGYAFRNRHTPSASGLTAASVCRMANMKTPFNTAYHSTGVGFCLRLFAVQFIDDVL